MNSNAETQSRGAAVALPEPQFRGHGTKIGHVLPEACECGNGGWRLVEAMREPVVHAVYLCTECGREVRVEIGNGV